MFSRDRNPSKQGRPNQLDSLWKLLSNLTGKRSRQLQGSQDAQNTGLSAATMQRRYNLEVDEIPIRNPEIANPLLEMCKYCYEARQSLSIARRDVFLSADGDDMGWTIADTLDDNETAIDPNVKAILLDLVGRYNGKTKVIGGRRLQNALTTALADGDCFMEFEIDSDGTKNGYGISKTLYLPSWEVFVDQSETGEVQGYYQTDRLIDRNDIQRMAEAGSIRYFHPAKIVHFAYEQQNRYGESLFKQSIQPWEDLKRITFDKREALRSLGVTPTIHIMPEGRDVRFLQNYERRYKEQLQQGIITDLFMLNGGEVKKLSNVNPDLRSFFNEVLDLRQHIVPAAFPQWLYPGLGLGLRGAREVAREPARAYARVRNDYCGMLTEGIRWFCDVELILKLGMDEYLKVGRGKYRVIFPQFSEKFDDKGNPQDQFESNEPGIEDTDDTGNDELDTPADAPEDKPAKKQKSYLRSLDQMLYS